MNRLISAGLIGGLALFLSACGSNEDAGSGTPVRVSATVAAVVNGEPILAAEVEVEAAAQGKIDVGDRLEFDDPVFAQILDQLIDQKLLAQEALQRGAGWKGNRQADHGNLAHTLKDLEPEATLLVGIALISSLVTVLPPRLS